jgi:hypothetical protein
MITLATFQFELLAPANGYDIAPAMSPTDIRGLCRLRNPAAFDTWTAGARTVARKLTESTLETGPLRDEILRLAGPE